jgi:hypothetical protein
VWFDRGPDVGQTAAGCCDGGGSDCPAGSYISSGEPELNHYRPSQWRQRQTVAVSRVSMTVTRSGRLVNGRQVAHCQPHPPVHQIELWHETQRPFATGRVKVHAR